MNLKEPGGFFLIDFLIDDPYFGSLFWLSRSPHSAADCGGRCPAAKVHHHGIPGQLGK
jgi:hypothetical protein